MLTKQQKQKAEEVRQQLAPLFAKASKLAGEWIKAKDKERNAYKIAQFWQYVETGTEWAHREGVPEDEQEQARTTKNANLRAWHEELEKRYKSESEAEKVERAAYYNLINYCYYIAEMVAETLRPYAWEVYQTRGDTLKEWAEIITPKEPKEWTPRTLYASIYFDSLFSDSMSLYISIWGAGACGVSAKIWKIYKKNPQQDKAENPQEPQKMTAKQYADRVQKLKDYETKAQQVRAEQWKKAKEWGLLDACELLKYPQTEKAR